MSINFPTDNSTQNSGRTFTAGSIYSGFTTSNYITSLLAPYDLTADRQSAILTLQANIDKKQNLLVSTCNLVGIGSSITQLDYNNITYNKPDLSVLAGGYWSLSNTTIFNLNSNIGIGTTNSSGYKLNVAGSLNASNIYENGSLISSKYLGLSGGTLTSNLIINNSFNLSEERQYPPKKFTSFTDGFSSTLLNKSVYSEIINLDTSGITYGSGDYYIYTSTWSGNGSLINTYFNFDTLDFTASSSFYWSYPNYSSNLYTQNNYILPNYLGDWLIIKLPVPIILTKFRFYRRSPWTGRAPAEWRCYGSMDGITFTEISQASQTTAIDSNAYINNNLYEKILDTGFNTFYYYIGWVVNKIIGFPDVTLQLNEIQIFGKENLSNFGYLGIGNSNTSYSLNVNGNLNANNIYENGALISSKYVSISGDASGLNNFKLQNQSILKFPPFYINTSNNTNIKASSYANGNYIITASSFATGKDPYLCFDGLYYTEWNPSSATAYNGTNNLYNGSYSTIVSGTSYNGEWIQLYYDKGFAAKSINISSSSASNLNSPTNFIIASSLDSSNWILLSSQVGITDYATVPTKTFNLINFTSYNYYRLIITKTIGDPLLKIIELSFTGNLNSTFNNNDTFNSIIYNTNEKQFPPAVYSTATPSTESTNSNELFNIVPTTYYKQTLTVNSLNYKIYSSSSTATATYNKQYIFDFNTASNATNFGRWAASQYNATTGVYSNATNSTIGLNNSYKGDWIIINFPYAIVLTKFIIWQTATIANSPKTWKCYGSNDGINWTEITEAASPISGAIYTSFSNTTTIPSYSDIPYTYLGWVFNSLTGSTSTQLEFVELQIFGKDDISNSYLNVWNKSNTNIYNTLGNVGIGTSNPSSLLTINNIPIVRNTYDHSTSPLTITHLIPTSDNVLNDPQTLINLCRDGTNLKAYGARASFKLSRYANNGTNSRTRFDLNLAHNYYDDVNVMTVLSSGNIGIGNTSPSAPLWIGRPDIASVGFLVISQNASGYRNFKMGYDNLFNFCFGDYGTVNGVNTFTSQFSIAYAAPANSLNINSSGNIGIGTTTPNALLELYSNVQSLPKMILSGTDFSTGTTSSSGVAFLLGSNFTNNRQVWIGDSANLGIGTTNPVIRVMPNIGTIDAVATNGTTALPLKIGNIGSSLYLNATNIYSNNNLIDFTSYATITTLSSTSNTLTGIINSSNTISSNYANAVSNILQTNINTKQDTLIFSSPIINTNNTITLNTTNLITTTGGQTINGNLTTTGYLYTSASVYTQNIQPFSTGTAQAINIRSRLAGNVNLFSETGFINFYTSNINRFQITDTGNAIFSENISENGVFLSSKYLQLSGGTLTSNLILNNSSSTLSSERQYPSKKYNYETLESTISLLGDTVFTQTLILNTTGITYGSGNYIIYSSTIYSSSILIYKKSSLFNYTFEDETAAWNDGQYTNGVYNDVNNKYIKSDYKGEWIIIQFPNPIILTRFIFYRRPTVNIYSNRVPGEWKCYGSSDGINFTEISEGSQSSRLSATNYSSTSYEKILNPTFTTPYRYIGWTVNKLAGTTANDTMLNFSEIQIFGKEYINTAYLSIGTNNTSTYPLNIVGDAYVNGNIILSGSLNQNNSAQNNILSGKLTIGTTISNSNNLNVVGDTKLDGSVIITGSLNQNNSTQSNIFMGKVGINTTDTTTYNLNVMGSLNTNAIYENTVSLSSKYLAITGDASKLNNLKLENQSNLTFPPISNFIASSATINSISSYGSGTYIISASSFATGKDPYLCFNNNPLFEWNPSLATAYNGISNFYTPITYSTVVSGSNYYGEWIQLYYDKGFAANSFTITGISASNIKCPNNFIVAGSIDSSNWNLLSSQSGILDYTTIPTKTFTIYNFTSYNYYRLIITKTIADPLLSISSLSFTGTQNTTFLNNDTYNNNTYNTNEKQFPYRAFDNASTETLLTSNELLNIVPALPYKQNLYVDNFIYSIYSSTTNAAKSNLFDNSSSTIGSWAANQYTSGSYSANTNYISNSNFKGDWIIIKFPFKIILTAYKFFQDSTNATTISSAPGTWKCYGSNDGVNWTEIIDASNSTVIAVYYGYTYTNFLPSYFDIPYLYIGWVFNKIISTTANYLSLTEIQIFGKDDNSSSLLLLNNTFNVNPNSNQKFPAAGFNSTITQTQTSTEIFNCSPVNVYKESAIVNNEGIYTVYYSSWGANAFTSLINNTTTETTTAPTWGANRYDGTLSVFTGGTFYLGDISYTGDWLVIKFPYKISMSQFRFYPSSTATNTAPGLWKCYGSNNGITWIEIKEASNTVTIASYSSSYYFSTLVKNTPFYLYIGWVVGKLVSSGSTSLIIAEVQVYGTSIIKTIGTNAYSQNVNQFQGKISIGNNRSLMSPLPGTFGGTGDKIILWEGSSGGYPYSIGMGAPILWNSIPSGARYEWYIGGLTVKMTLNSSGILYSDGSGLNNLQLENQSAVSFPPTTLNSTSGTWSASTLGHGTYTASSSTNASSKEAFRAFDNSSTTEWCPSTAPYTGANNVYVGSVSTIVSNTTYAGEWVQLYYDKGFSLTSLAISGISASNLRCPNSFILAASINNSNWTLLSSQVGITDYITTPTKTFNIYNYTNYNYYRIIVTKTIGDSNLRIQNISFKGTQNSTYANIDTLNNIIYNTNEKQFLPAVYSSAIPATEAIITIQEIYNCIPSLSIKQTLTINNQNYYIYSSTSSGINKELLFNPSNTNIVSWAATQYTNGVYSANANYIFDNTYKGDWIIIQFPFKIILTKFSFTQTTNTNRSPSKWKLYGSFDGVNWNEITEGNNIIGATYTNSKIITSLPSHFDIPYLYYGWVFSALFGTAADASQLEIKTFEIYGKDDIANAYSNVWIKSNSNIYNNIGNVGIGTTDTSIYKLNVAGNTNFGGDVSISGSLNQTNSTQSNVFMGKVGIGTINNSDYYKLVIRGGSVSFASGFTITSSDDVFRFHFANYGPTYLYASSADIQQFKFRKSDNLSDILTIYDNNKVYVSSNIGIGITNPTQNLAVIGTGYFSSNVGIGTTDVSQYKLNISGNTKFDGDVFISGSLNTLDYGTENKYPPEKIYDSYSSTVSTTFLGQSCFKQTITFNPYPNGYGIGNYNIYMSSLLDQSLINYTPKDLFDNTTSNTGSHWSNNYVNGIYSKSSNIVSGYNGEWIIIQLPIQILITKFQFYNRPTNVERVPGEWKLYGSNDGITFTEIIEGSQMTRLVLGDYPSGYYELKLASTATTAYSYYGWCVNKVVGTSETYLNFSEIKIFGKEKNTYISNNANLPKTYNISIPNSNFWFDNTNSLYCYDLYIEKYAPSIDRGGGYKERAFNITTFKTLSDWNNKTNLLINNEYINYPETLTFLMNNTSNVNGTNYPNNNYANYLIQGKTKDTNIGYWNPLTSNLNSYFYIRYMTKQGQDLSVVIENILQ